MPKVNRGHYCTAFKSCESKNLFRINPDVCKTCTAFNAIFKNVDPAARAKFMLDKKDLVKICSNCGQTIPANRDFFYADKGASDKLSAWCKKCHKKPSKKKAAPVEPSTKQIKEDGQKMTDEKLKKCSKCKQDKPATKKNFYASKQTKDRLNNWCKDCHLKSSRKNKPAPKTKSADRKKPTGVDTDLAQINEKVSQVIISHQTRMAGRSAVAADSVLTLNFTGHENLLNDLAAKAKEEFRTPENQLLYWLANVELHEKIII